MQVIISQFAHWASVLELSHYLFFWVQEDGPDTVAAVFYQVSTE